MLRALDYTVEDRILNAADYGDATTRKRLFIQAKRGRRKIVWPEPTHLKPQGDRLDLLQAKPWRAAREIIDWNIPGESIYTRKRPLSPNTMRRIMSGLHKYSGLPFVMPTNHGKDVRTHSVGDPMPTVTAFDAMALAQPFLVVLRNNCDGSSIDGPVPTIAASANHIGIAEPFLVNQKGRSIGGSIDQLTPTITAGARHLCVAEPFLVPNFGERQGQNPRCQAITDPLPAVTGHGAGGLVEPFLVKYHGSETQAHSINNPLGTITGRDRFALVDPQFVHDVDGEIIGWLDIRFRMLQPHELAAAMSFPAGYKFTGSREAQVKQIGNAVPVRLATALCKAMLNSNTTHTERS